MKVSEVKRLFVLEFYGMGLSLYDLRNTWYSFVNELFEAGEINLRVFQRCNALEIA